VGTGGTLTGVGSHFRELKKEVKIFAVEPEKSPVLSGGIASPHKIQGIGAGIIPEVLDTTLYDEVLRVTEEEAITQTRKLAEKGLLLGISSGAAIHAAFDVARKIGANKHVVVVAADNGERYLSTDIFAQKNYEEAKNE
jgi:cysteine synthase A